MATLNEKQKMFILIELACFQQPTDVTISFKEEYGIEINRGQVAQYDPTNLCCKASKKWQEFFWAARKKFQSNITGISIANRAYRLKELNRLYALDIKRGNTVGAAAKLEQAAKDTGGSFTNQRQLTGKDGGPIKTEDVNAMSREEVTQALADLRQEQDGGAPPEPAPEEGEDTTVH